MKKKCLCSLSAVVAMAVIASAAFVSSFKETPAKQPETLTEETGEEETPEAGNDETPGTAPGAEIDDATETGNALDADDEYLLAKIAMAEAEGEDTEGKALVVLVVLNRVHDEAFPDTVWEVIMEEHGGIHQFGVTQDGGRWWSMEPDEDCYEAVEMVADGWDESRGALYFESRSQSTWHQEHLQFLFQHGNHYFYTEKG